MEDPPLSLVPQLQFSVQVVPHTQKGGTHTHRTHSKYGGGNTTNQARVRDGKSPLGVNGGGGEGGEANGGQINDIHKIVIGDNISGSSGSTCTQSIINTVVSLMVAVASSM